VKYNLGVQKRNGLFWIGNSLIIIFVGFLVWTFIPSPDSVYQFNFRWDELLKSQDSILLENQSSLSREKTLIPENYAPTIALPQSLELTIPRQIWLGERSQIQMLIGLDQSLISKSINMEMDSAQKLNDNVPRVLIIANLDINNLNVNPATELQQVFRIDNSLNYHWDISPRETGEYDGLLWIEGYLLDNQNNKRSHFILNADPFTIRVKNLFGLSIQNARWLSGVGLFVICIFGLENWVARRIRAGKNPINFQEDEENIC
jgi:hypothetical protein